MNNAKKINEKDRIIKHKFQNTRHMLRNLRDAKDFYFCLLTRRDIKMTIEMNLKLIVLGIIRADKS